MATYTVKSGDTFWGIAQEHGLSESELKAINPQITKPELIRPTDQIIIPGQQEAKIEGGPIQRTSQEPLSSMTTGSEPMVGSGGSDTKLEDWKILNPELAKDLFPDPVQNSDQDSGELIVGSGGVDMKLSDFKSQNPELAKDLFPDPDKTFLLPEKQGEIVATDTLETKGTQFPDAGLRSISKYFGVDQQFIALTDPVITYLFENTLSSLGLPYALDNNGELMYRSPEEMSGLKTEAKASLNNAAQTLGFNPPLTENEDIEKAVLEVIKKLPEKEKKEVNKSTIKETIKKGQEAVKDFFMPEPEPNMDVADDAINAASELASPVVKQTEVETVSESPGTEVVKITKPGDVKKVVQDEKTADAIIEYGNTNFMFEDGLDKSALERIDKNIQQNNEKLTEIFQGKLKPYFGKDDTGRKFLAAIAAGLGAYASAMTGTPNFALNIINKAIDDDLAIQKEELERQRLSILDQNKILAESRAELYAEADRLFNQQVAQAGLKLDQEQINTTKDAIDQKRKQAELENKQAQIAAEFEAAQEFKAGIIPGMGATALDAGFIDLPKGSRRDKAAENAAKYMEGYFKVGGSGDKKEKEQLMKKVRKVGYFKLSESERAKLGLIGQIRALVENERYNVQIPFTDARDTLRSLHQELRLFYQKDVMGAGANLTLNEMVQVLNLTGDLEAQFGGRLMINSGRYEKLMDRLQVGLEEKRIAKREAFGIKPLTSKQSKKTDKSYVNFLESVD